MNRSIFCVINNDFEWITDKLMLDYHTTQLCLQTPKSNTQTVIPQKLKRVVS